MIHRAVCAVLLIIAAGAAFVGLLLAFPHPLPAPVVFGVSFSAPYAESIGLDWREAYRALLDDLPVRHLRLSAYWNGVEPEEGRFDFADLDWQMDQAAETGASVVLGVGRKLPRWPECHEPAWVQNKTEAEKQQHILEMLRVVVERYRHHPALARWQLENEPLFDFGVCPPEDRDFLRQEEALLRSLDAEHSILITDSGELISWLGAALFGDMVGTTMYRTVFSSRTQKPFSYDYIFPAWLYRLKARTVKLFSGKDVLISELQGEPWGFKPLPEMTPAERAALLSPERLREMARFAARTQLTPAFWWGAEYWYWEKVNGNPAYWETARTFFSDFKASPTK
jgi:hypothetical protein